MTAEEIKKNAPIGATHYLNIGGDGVTYMKMLNDKWYYFFSGWFVYSGTFGSQGIKPL